MSFSLIPWRGYGVPTDPSWWNSLKQAGILLEAGFTNEISFTLGNNQVAPADITPFIFNPASVGGFVAEYRIYRNTTGAGATELVEQGFLLAAYAPVSNTWTCTPFGSGAAGITFSITPAGQVQYTSTNITGTPASSYIRFKSRTSAL